MRKKRTKPNSWSVILSSGANEPVKQFRLSKILFYSSTIFVFLLIISVASLTYFINELSTDQKGLYVELEKRDMKIEEVKSEYVSLQEEALAVQRSIEEFRAFEERLNQIDLQVPSDLEEVALDGLGGTELPEKTIAENEENISASLRVMREKLPQMIRDFEDTVERLLAYEEELRTIPTIMPAAEGRITSEFGNRTDPISWDSSFHSGIDIAAPLNTPIYSTADGEVIAAGRDGGYGLRIIIEHGDTYETLYAHLNYIDVEVGDKVKKGDKIGGMGTTGRSTGVHVHYEVRRNGELINPYLYMTFHETDKGDEK
ncbi:peptidoglycan DD-metalloendopeptidase family protein [Evansella sp. AB-P1]|uniref:M23 family metallopeptidase n=1 Tax=Evansella sp. AB-P1 TaxID=3037653 RepID=UPI00241F23C4|nr:M23 family metallopeptidase [Evansella sp. AB-P1]MDG5789532.1 peptidoglycan DD-metalloendopeptidase family protein [Evansella sp. AB-P1]